MTDEKDNIENLVVCQVTEGCYINLKDEKRTVIGSGETFKCTLAQAKQYMKDGMAELVKEKEDTSLKIQRRKEA